MTESESVSGAPTADDGAQGGKTETKKADQSTEKKVVPWEDHRRAIDDMHKFKKEREELKARLGTMESERLREKEDFKGLAERYQKERDEFKTKYDSLHTSLEHNAKFAEVRSAALKSGLRAEAESDLELLGLDNVELEVTSAGRFLVRGAEGFVEELKKTRPYWFKDERAPKVNTGGANPPTVTSEDLTPRKYVELERQYRKQGKTDEIRKLHERYQKQKLSAARR